MPPHRQRTWFAQAMVLLSGVSLLNALPRPRRMGDGSAALGRGQPEVPASLSSRSAGYETADMSGAALAKLLAGWGAVVATVIVTMALGVAWLRQPAPGIPLTAQQVAPLQPPPPNLQADPMLDIARLRARENVLLGQYAWIDAGHTRARVPIERGRALVLGKPLDTAP